MAKAGRPKKGSAGLPKWFDIEKYRPVTNFKAIDWFQQLAFRRSLSDAIQYLEKNNKEKIEEFLKEALTLLKSDPIITRSRIHDAPLKKQHAFGQMLEALDRMLGIALSNMMSAPAGIRSITYSDLSGLSCSLPEDLRAGLAQQMTFFFEGFNGVPDQYKNVSTDLSEANDFLLALFGETRRPIVAIDLNLTDAVLLAEFKGYLKAWRQHLGKVSPPFLKNQDFSKWYNSGVLPYLDLKLWEAVTGETIRWATFTGALTNIADKPVGSESALMKTTKTHAKKLMEASTLRILQSQALREDSGLLKQSGKFAAR